MNSIPLPALQDDALWWLHDGRRGLEADPGDAQPVLPFLQRDGLQLEGILVTPHPPGPVRPRGPVMRRAAGSGANRPALVRPSSFIESALTHLKFESILEPHDLKLIHYIQRCEELRERELPACPPQDAAPADQSVPARMPHRHGTGRAP